MPSPNTTRWATGPWVGSRWTNEPYDDTDALLGFLTNGYLPDPMNGSAAYARQGFSALGVPSGITDPVIWGFCTTTGADGTPYSFVVMEGRLFRVNVSAGTFTDVTPIATGTGTVRGKITDNVRVFFCPTPQGVVVNDGVNVPWVMTNLGATPVTATPIPFDEATTIAVLKMGSVQTAIGWDPIAVSVNGVTYDITNNDVGDALPAGTIPIGQWGIYRVTFNPTGSTYTVTAGAANYTTGYATESAAITALPAIPANSGDMGYFTVQASAIGTFIANTSALAGGTGGVPAQNTYYYPPLVGWSAYGQPVLYYGSVFFIAATINNGLPARTAIVWSEPNLPLVGYQQTDYDNLWDLTQTGSTPLYTLVATNDALYYSRRQSWGALGGAPNINFQNTASHDVVSGNVGCVAPAATCLFLNMVYFLDQQGRLWRFGIGGTPEPLWTQFRKFYQTEQADYTSEDVELTAWMAIEPTRNVLLIGVAPLLVTAGLDMLSVDAVTGHFLGAWAIGAAGTATYGGILTYGTSASDDNQTVLAVNSNSLAASEGLWVLSRPDANQWEDVNKAAATFAVPFSVQTGQMGYALFDRQQVEYVGVLAEGTDAAPTAVTVALGTTQQAVSVTPASSGNEASDTTRARFIAMFGRPMGRSSLLTISTASTSTTKQVFVHRVEVVSVISAATVRDI